MMDWFASVHREGGFRAMERHAEEKCHNEGICCLVELFENQKSRKGPSNPLGLEPRRSELNWIVLARARTRLHRLLPTRGFTRVRKSSP